MPRRHTQIAAVAALLVAIVGGAYAARELVHSDAAPTSGSNVITCPANASGWSGRVAGARPAASMPQRERRVVQLVNAFRIQHGLHALTPSVVLADAARAHSRDMLQRQFFAHDAPAGRSFSQRLARYTPQSCIAETIAWGSGPYGTADGIVTAWKNSAGHRRVMLLPWVKRIGVGTAAGTYLGAGGATVATADFSA